MNTIAMSFIACLVGFVVIGLLSTFKKQKTNEDYLLAGKSMPPWLVSLAAVATQNSGFMFIGMIGYTYGSGLSSIWLMIGWLAGDLISSTFVHRRLREATGRTEGLSYSEVLARWNGTDWRSIKLFGGIATLVFLGTYAAAQLQAGSKALHVLFGWDYASGAIIGSVMVVAYCFAGGIRASIWTNAAQSFVMFGAIILMFVVGYTHTDGWSQIVTDLGAVSPNYLSLMPSDMMIPGGMGVALFALGWVFAGFGVVGQPHIMMCFMTMKKPEQMQRIRLYYYGWFASFWLLVVGVGFMARLLLPETAEFDAELALPTLSQQLLPDVLVGLVLAGLFAATISTADSQILSCTAAITRDLFPRIKSYMLTKLVTIGVTGIALAIALAGPDSVFDLTLIAWSALAAIFSPLLVVYALGGRPDHRLALSMMAAGLVVVMCWRWAELSDAVYDALPGMLAGLIVYNIGKRLGGELPHAEGGK